MRRLLIPALLLACIAALPLRAQTAIGTPVTGEILPGWQQPDGSRVAAIRLKLAPGWKTYWRSPGDAGIPPLIDWSGSRNLAGVRIIWPAPKVFEQNGVRTIGYKDTLVLPLSIAPRNTGRPVSLDADLDIGVCEDICVPFRLRLRGTLDASARTPTPAIAAALAARPYTSQEAGVTAATCVLRPNAEGMQIDVALSMPATGGAEVVVIEPGPGLWASETDSVRSGNRLTATGDLVPAGGAGFAVDRSAITITVLGKSRAVEINGCAPG